MPKKFSLTEMRKWLESYEQGKSEVSIAKASRCDVRTVKRGIEQARRERDAHTARAELLKDALRKHQDSLLAVVEQVLSALNTPPANLDIPWRWEGGSKWVQLNAVRAEVRGGDIPVVSIVLNVESKPEWELLQEHLKRDPGWGALARWRNVVAADIGARMALMRKTATLLREKTGYEVIEHIDRAPEVGFVWPVAVDLLYQVAFNRALAIPDETNPEDYIVATPAGYLEFGGAGAMRLAYARGSEEKCKQDILEAFEELQVSAEAKSAAGRYREAEEVTIKARRAVEEIRLLGLVPGQCRVCRRLGL